MFVVIQKKKKRRKGILKIILVGHSFGSQLGVWNIQKFPEDAECYVGIGQAVDTVRNEAISFEFTLNEAKKRNDKRAIRALLKIGPPVNGFFKEDKILLQRNYLNKMGGILKEIFEFEKSGHTPQWEKSEKFNSLFINNVSR